MPNLFYNPLSTIIQSALEDKIEEITISEDTSNYISKSPIAVSGELNRIASFNAPSVKVSNTSIQNDARMKIDSSAVTIQDSTLSGTFQKTTGNAIITVNNATSVKVESINASDFSSYNGIEVGLNSSNLPKTIRISDCDFNGDFSNNAINLFDFEDGTSLIIENCHFKKVSNMLRLSNKSNNSISITIRDCSIDQWTPGIYAGLICLQDYTSSRTSYEEANQFGPNKVSISIENCVGPTGLITEDLYPKTSYGSGASDQLMYIYVNAINAVRPYDEGIYPNVKIS